MPKIEMRWGSVEYPGWEPSEKSDALEGLLQPDASHKSWLVRDNTGAVWMAPQGAAVEIEASEPDEGRWVRLEYLGYQVTPF